jgi:hypothetical protein
MNILPASMKSRHQMTDIQDETGTYAVKVPRIYPPALPWLGVKVPFSATNSPQLIMVELLMLMFDSNCCGRIASTNE